MKSRDSRRTSSVKLPKLLDLFVKDHNFFGVAGGEDRK